MNLFEPAVSVPSGSESPGYTSSSYGTFPGMSGSRAQEGPKLPSTKACRDRASILLEVHPRLQACGFATDKAGSQNLELVERNVLGGHKLAVWGLILLFVCVYLFYELWLGAT